MRKWFQGECDHAPLKSLLIIASRVLALEPSFQPEAWNSWMLTIFQSYLWPLRHFLKDTWLFAPLSKSFSFLAPRVWLCLFIEPEESTIETGVTAQKEGDTSTAFEELLYAWLPHSCRIPYLWAQFSILINNLVPQCEDCGPERLETWFSSRLFQGEEQTTETKRWTVEERNSEKFRNSRPAGPSRPPAELLAG